MLDIVGITVDVIGWNAGAFDEEQFPKSMGASDLGRGRESGWREPKLTIGAFDQTAVTQ
jgi:hypothetical protein